VRWPSPRFGALVALALLSSACSRLLPDLQKEYSKTPRLAQSTRIYDARGRLITTLHAEEDRVVIPIKRIPKDVQKAVVAIEDQRFWSHRGIDLKALLRAAYANVTSGAIVEGGSTITQQYVKNRYLEPERTLGRKIKEAALAWQLEEDASKRQILAKYLNTVYFGQGAYGIQRAARKFFSVPASDLTLPQSALLAGLIAGPERWDPIESPDAAVERRDLVLTQMLDLGMISPERYQAAVGSDLGLRLRLEPKRYEAPYFISYVKRAFLTDERFGETYTQRYNLLFRGGLRIYTTVDLDMQDAAEQAVKGILSQPGDPYGALTAVDPRTGFIRAMVGGRNYFAPRKKDKYAQVNLATGGSTGRQAGSSFKPFALVAALESGIPPTRTYPAPSSIVLNEPPCGSEDYPWNVENYEGSSYGGSLTVEQATVSSVNVVYAQIIRDVGPEAVVETAHRMGIRSRLRPFCSSVLGTNEVNTLEMASAFGTLATGGELARPVAIERIEDSHGRVIYEAPQRRQQVLDKGVAYVATQILEDVILSGTGTAANLGRPAAGKTGTAQQWRDAWFVGFIPQLVAGVWVGWPQGQISMTGTRIGNVTGGSFPAQIWHAFMSQVTPDIPVRDFKEPEGGFVTLPIDITQGCVAAEGTPAENIEYQQFVEGTEPGVCEAPSEPLAETVPSVVGMAASEAYAILTEAGFAVSQTARETRQYSEGTVIRQVPSGGTQAESGATVTLTVATSP
jgi:penicillin-binding protein 1A